MDAIAKLRMAVSGVLLLVWAGAGSCQAFAKEEASGKSRQQDVRSPEAAEVQIRLDQANFSPGPIDSKWGEKDSRTHDALRAFQAAHGLNATGELDEQTSAALASAAGAIPVWITYRITEDDVKGPFAPKTPACMEDKAKLKALDYTSPEELLSEKFHMDSDFFRQNDTQAALAPGQEITVPNVAPMEPSRGNESGKHEEMKASKDRKEEKSSGDIGKVRVVVSGRTKTLAVQDASGKVVFFAPITPGSKAQPLPKGEIEVTSVSRNPDYHYDPKVLKDPKEGGKPAVIPPGPNNPVGLVWIDLSKEHYGIHGTPEPEKIGYSASHGCVRLTNWDALKVARLVKPGTKVIFEQ